MDPLLIVVDDDHDDQELIKDSLATIPNAPNTIYLASGDDLLDFLSGRPIPLKHICITIDINMPGINGVDLLAILKKHPHYKDIPVSIITTTSENVIREKCISIGANHFFTKPVQLSDWKRILQSVIA